MKAKFYIVPNSSGDEPADPNPIAFPIKIISDPAPAPSSDAGQDGDMMPAGKRSDDFYPAWKKFLTQEPKRGKSRKVASAKDALKKSGGTEGLQVQENAATSWEQAAAECRAKVAAIIEECKRLNQKYRDPLFDLEASPYCLQSLSGRFPKAVDRIDTPPWIKRVEDIFDDPQFYIDGATANDVHQGSSGDCWFLASLMAVSAKKELIERLCVARDEKVGVYGFVFYRDGEWIYEVIDDKLFLRVGDDDDLAIVRDWNAEKKEGMSLKYDDEKLKLALQKGGEALYFSHCKSNETWLPLIEKAYAKAHGDYTAIEGGFASEGIEDLTGGVGVVLNPEDIMDKERFWREQLSQVNIKYLFGGGSKPSPSKGFVGGHAYAVLEAWEEGDLKLLKLRNPWGDTEWEGDWSDGSKLWTAEMMTKLKHTFGDDGVFWISYLDFLKHFPAINRVRLFDSDWSVSQQWTSVNVPWTVDYLDTKFQFTVTQRGPVVVALSQPDDRYFYGLRGRYLFSMHFRVCKADSDEDAHWIVRSMHNSGNETVFTRAVSAEIEDLEPGTYDVIFKVTATRQSETLTAEEVILKYAVDRKEKLLRVGRRFEYAQTKGNLEALEIANRNRIMDSSKMRQKKEWKKGRKVAQKERERGRLRKKRVGDAMREKRKALEAKQQAKTQAEGNGKAADPTEDPSAEAQPDAAETITITTNPSTSEDKSDIIPTPQTDEEGKELESERAPTKDATAPTEGQNETPAASEPQQGSSDSTTEDQSGKQLSTELEKLDLETRPDDGGAPAHTADNAAEPAAPTSSDDNAASAAPTGPLPLTEEASSTKQPEPAPPVVVRVSGGEDDSEAEPPEELEDDDFDWNSDMDGPVYSDEFDEDDDDEDDKDALFASDPWNAMCVLGLRVYSKDPKTTITIVKGENDS